MRKLVVGLCIVGDGVFAFRKVFADVWKGTHFLKIRKSRTQTCMFSRSSFVLPPSKQRVSNYHVVFLKWAWRVFKNCFVVFSNASHWACDEVRSKWFGTFSATYRTRLSEMCTTSRWHFMDLYKRYYIFRYAHWINYPLIFRKPQTDLRAFGNKTPDISHWHVPHFLVVKLC